MPYHAADFILGEDMEHELLSFEGCNNGVGYEEVGNMVISREPLSWQTSIPKILATESNMELRQSRVAKTLKAGKVIKNATKASFGIKKVKGAQAAPPWRSSKACDSSSRTFERKADVSAIQPILQSNMVLRLCIGRGMETAKQC